jgi:hypothetical protein
MNECLKRCLVKSENMLRCLVGKFMAYVNESSNISHEIPHHNLAKSFLFIVLVILSHNYGYFKHQVKHVLNDAFLFPLDH